MENALKAFKLDMATVKKSSKTYVLFFILAIVFIVSTSSTFGISYLFLVTIIITTAPFSTESNTNISKFTYSLPMEKVDLVKGRYLFLAMCLLIAITVGATVTGIQYSAGQYTQKDIIQCIITALMLSLTIMVQFPLYYKYGMQKGRLLSLLVYIVPILLAFILPEIIVSSAGNTIQNPSILITLLASFGLLVIGFLISYCISLAIFLAKEL